MLRSLFFLALLTVSCTQKRQFLSTNSPNAMPTTFDWQGHRGARGLLPENTVPSFLRALEYPEVVTLELDLAVSKDKQLIVSHEPWMSSLICSHPDGRPISEKEEQTLRIYDMTAAEVQAFDCGQRGNTNYPEQMPLSAVKPTLEEVVVAAEQYARTLQRPLPYYNIEIKSLPEWDQVFTPKPEAFAALVLRELQRLDISQRANVQSFDLRTLRALKEQAPRQRIAYLIANQNGLEQNLKDLGFRPDIYSPYYLLCTPELTDSLHKQNIKLIPWTVNKTAEMQQLIDMGVDGIITDYPDRIPQER